MPIETNLTGAPYHDDFDASKGDVRVLYRPGVPVQTRELNQTQSIVSDQIEAFADNIFRRGTIIDGCSFNFIESYPFVKILDAETNFTPSNPSAYVGMFVRNSSNLQAFVVDYADGFESASPDLKTLYLSYVNSGDDSNTFQYTPGETLTIFDGRVGVHGVDINAAGVGFSNTDRLVIVPAVVVNASSGTFANGDYVTQPSTGANLQVYWVDDTSLATAGQVILGLRARTADLTNAAANSSSWAVANAETIRTSTNSAVGVVERVVGLNATGSIRTDGSGRISNVAINNRGSGYTSAPFVSVYSPNNSVGVSSLQLNARNFAGRVSISGAVGSTGNGYAFGVSEGRIYSKGHFLRVKPQTIVVSKYDQLPDDVAVGFVVDEEIVTSQQDTSLLDNVIGDNNGAPGADRLRLTPRLEVVVKSDLTPESDFFTLVAWSRGKPFRQSPKTVYAEIGDEMARRTADESGDYVVDKFLIATKSPTTQNDQSSKIDVVVDPGTAYVSGYKVQTNKNYTVSVDSSTETRTSNDSVVSLSYGSWILVKEIGGVFQFSTGDVVDLYGSPSQFLSVGRLSSSTPATSGVKLGEARVRSMTYVNGVPGTPGATYKMYLFDIKMSPGRNFKDVKSVYYDGSFKGVADVVTETDGTTGQQICRLRDSDKGGLIFEVGVESLRNITGATYTYRTIFQDATFANNGTLTKSLASSPSEFFSQPGAQSDSLMQSMYVAPIGGDLLASNSLTGTVSVNATSSVMIGTGTSFTSLRTGDFVRIVSGANSYNRRVVSVSNNTYAVLDEDGEFANTSALAYRVFPRNAPIPFGVREGLSANVDSNGNILTLNLGISLSGSTGVNTALAVDVVRREVTSGTKVATRDRYVKISLANVEYGTTGPWCLGVPDAFRLKGVWMGSNSSVDESSTNVTQDFYVDPNHTKDYADLSWLYKRPDSSASLSSSSWLLVKFDYFTVSNPGFYATPSYVSANLAQTLLVDSKPLSNLGTQVNSHEIPEVYTATGKTYDLRACLDFRPIASNTVGPASSPGSSPVNPSSELSFGDTSNPANDKKFPLPLSAMVADVEVYKGRIDSIVVGKDGEISVLRGTPGVTLQEITIPKTPRDAMQLGILAVPPYPTIPENPSESLDEIINTRRGNERYEVERLGLRTVTSKVTPAAARQVEGVSMARIGQMERRIEALEYQVSLNQVEAGIKNLVIPSSVDSGSERFKFGFVADTFSNTSGLDVGSPSHSAMVMSGDLTPIITLWGVDFGNGQTLDSPYIDYPIVEQTYATYTPIEGETDCIDDGTITSNYVIRFQTDISQKGRSGFEFGDYIDVEEVTVSNTATPMTLYFHAYSYGDYIAVYQGNTIVANTQGAVALTTEDRSKLTNTPELRPWFSAVTFDPLVIENTRFAKGSGKLTWTHNPAAGRTYTIITAKGTSSGRWRWALEYPVGTGLLSCPTSPSASPILYSGTLSKYTPPPSGGGGGGSSGGGGNSGGTKKLDAIDILYMNTVGRMPTAADKAFWSEHADKSSNDKFYSDFVYEASKETAKNTGSKPLDPSKGLLTPTGPGAAGTNALINSIRKM